MGPNGSISHPVAQLAKRSHLSSYILFVEGLLGAAASLETSFCKSCYLVVLHESLHACRWYDLPPETCPCCDSRPRNDANVVHTQTDVETMVVTATRGLLVLAHPPGWT